jgi:glycosyltransferase involved in cell wall biosynthesis
VLLFSSSSETQGLVLVEALAAGLPIVAVDTPQSREVLAGAGYLAASDAFSLAASIRRALRIGVLEMRAGPAVAKRYDAGSIGDRTIALYRSLVSVPAKAV